MTEKTFVIVGKGGREHCLARLLSQSSNRPLHSVGGSDAVREVAGPVEGDRQLSLDGPIPAEGLPLVTLEESPDVATVIFGPEQPLAEGWVDQLERYRRETDREFYWLGPNQQAAQLESSKGWCKAFLQRWNVPTGEAVDVHSLDEFDEIQEKLSPPYVIKADGLAAGKGVGIFEDFDEARQFVRDVLEEKKYGSQTHCLVEEFLDGTELSIFLLLDGERACQLGMARDHKRLQDGDKGPNTGGMGAYSPLADIGPGGEKEIYETVISPLLKGLAEEDIFYRGFLYLGLIRTKKGFHVLEINVRMGDPETQVVLPLIAEGNRLATLFHSAARGDFTPSLESDFPEAEKVSPQFYRIPTEKTGICVVLASPGYPEAYQKGMDLPGLENETPSGEGGYVFHGGTRRENNRWVTNGGRVLGVVQLADTLENARKKCYDRISNFEFDTLFYRQDIARRET